MSYGYNGPEAYLEPSRTSTRELFADVRLIPKYTSDVPLKKSQKVVLSYKEHNQIGETA